MLKLESSAILNKDALVFYQEYNPELIQTIKSVAGRKYDANTRSWHVPVSAVQRALEIAVQYGYRIDSEVEAMAQAAIAQASHKAKIALQLAHKSHATESAAEIAPLGVDLYPFQRAGVEYARLALSTGKGVMIADEMGLGKTIQAIALVESMDAYPALIVCPASVRLNWAKEIYRAVPHRSVSTTHTHMADYTIVNYEQLGKVVDYKFRMVVADESHYAKNEKAKRSKNLLKIAQRVAHVLLLTGTPVLNRPAELWFQLRIMERHKDFGNKYDFMGRYCAATHTGWGWDYKGASNLGELNTRLRRLCFIRREKKEVLKELPPIQRSAVPMETDSRIMKEYKRAKSDIVAWIREKSGNVAAWRAARAEVLTRMNKLRRLAYETRKQSSFAFVDELLEENGKLIVFATHRDVIADVAMRYNADTIQGGISIDKRQAAVERFQNDPDARVIAININSGAEGITLTASSVVVFMEMGWNPGKHQQAEARVHRIGQESTSVNAYYLVAPETFDVTLYEMLREKGRITNAVNSGVDVSDEIDDTALNYVLDQLMAT